MTTERNMKKRYKSSKYLVFIVLVVGPLLIILNFIYPSSDDHFHQMKHLNGDISIEVCTFQKETYKDSKAFGTATFGKGYFGFEVFLSNMSESDYLLEEKMDIIVYVDGNMVEDCGQLGLNNLHNQIRPDDLKLELRAYEKAAGTFTYEINRKFELIEIHIQYVDNEKPTVFRIKRPKSLLQHIIQAL